MDCRKFARSLCGSILFLTSGAASAAVDGALASSSSGSLQINLTTVNSIRISNLSDIFLGFNGEKESVGSSPACIYRNGVGNYSVSAHGSGKGGSFRLEDGGANSIPYSVAFDDGSGAQQISSGGFLNARRNASTSSPSCADTGNNARIDVRISARTVSSVPAGTYTGTLTLVVAPE